MNDLCFGHLPGAQVRAWRDGGPDAYGNLPERLISTGAGCPCRHCLDFVPAGQEMLVLACRPFDHLQPYAETGPIFLCADDCAGWSGDGVPPVLRESPDYLLKGYSQDQRIVYGTGRIVPSEDISSYASALLARGEIAFVDVRSARNNCFLSRITRPEC